MVCGRGGVSAADPEIGTEAAPQYAARNRCGVDFELKDHRANQGCPDAGAAVNRIVRSLPEGRPEAGYRPVVMATWPASGFSKKADACFSKAIPALSAVLPATPWR